MRESERKARQRAELRTQGFTYVTVVIPSEYRTWVLDAAKLLRKGLSPAAIERDYFTRRRHQPVDDPSNSFASSTETELKPTRLFRILFLIVALIAICGSFGVTWGLLSLLRGV